jgi:hypothetical protein
MQIEARYSEALIRRIALRFWLRYTGWCGIAATAALACIFAYLVIAGDCSWYVYVLGTALAFGALVGLGGYFMYCHRGIAAFRRMPDPVATMNFSDTGIVIQSGLGKSELSWRAVTEIWTFPEAWLVFLAKGSYFTIPTESLTDEVRRFISQKVQEHAGKVR